MSDNQTNTTSSENDKLKKKNKADKTLTGVIIIIVLLLIGYNIISHYSANIFLPGRNFQEINGIDPDSGRNARIDISEGTVIVNFWAVWCGSCIKELYLFNDISRKVKVVGILKKPYTRGSLSKLRLPYANIVGEDSVFEDMKISVLPTTILVENGVIKKVQTGIVTSEMLNSWLAADE